MATSHMMIGGGAEHPVEMVRRWIYAGEGGAEGIAEPGDLVVRPLAVTGGGVRVAIGSGFIRSLAAGAVREMYMGSVVTEEVVPIPPNEGDQVRYDLIVMRVRDPYWQGSPWPTPPDPVFGQYVFIDRIPSVSSTTTRVQDVVGHENDTAITLARIGMQPGTSVLEEMIVDLRKVARPRREVHTRSYELVGDEESQITSVTAYPVGSTWPSHAEVDASWGHIDIPEWATRARIVMTWSGVRIPGGVATGYVWCMLGDLSNQHRRVTQGRKWDASRAGFRATGDISIHPTMRGTRQGLYPRAARLSGSTATAPVLDSGSGLDLTVEFFGEAG